jgi:hypothetical protein
MKLEHMDSEDRLAYERELDILETMTPFKFLPDCSTKEGLQSLGVRRSRIRLGKSKNLS